VNYKSTNVINKTNTTEGILLNKGLQVEIETKKCESNQVEMRVSSLLKLDGLIEDRPATILIDCGASSNFIDEEFVRRQGITTELINRSDESSVKLANGDKVRIMLKTPSLRLCLKNYSVNVNFTVMKLNGYPAILVTQVIDCDLMRCNVECQARFSQETRIVISLMAMVRLDRMN